MLKEEEGCGRRPDCWIQVRLQAGNEVPNTKASDRRQRHIDGERRRSTAAAVRMPAPRFPDGGVQVERVATYTQPSDDARLTEFAIRGAVQGPKEGGGGARVELRPFPQKPEDVVLPRAMHRGRNIPAARFGENLQHEPLLGEGNVLPTKAHARVGSQHERKADNIGDGGTPLCDFGDFGVSFVAIGYRLRFLLSDMGFRN